MAVQAMSWRPVAASAAALWLASRIVLTLVTYFTGVLNDHSSLRTSRGYVIGARSLTDLVGAWVRWDADWYLQISRLGYSTEQASAFFPLYPLLIAALTALVGEAGRAAVAMVISNLAALLAFVGVGLLAAHELRDRAAAARTVLVAAAYPLALFLAAPYTDALFLAAAAFTLLFARQGRWRWAGLAALLGALTRPTGAILILPLVFEFGRQQGWSEWFWTRPLQRPRPSVRTLMDAVCALGSVPVAFLFYMSFLAARFGDPLIFIKVQERYWIRKTLPPWETARVVAVHLVSDPTFGFWQALLVMDLGLLLLFIGLTIWMARRQPVSFTLFMAGLLVLCVASPNLSNLNPLSSASRFLTAGIPVFIGLATLIRDRPWLELLVVGGGFALQAVFITLYLSGGWLA
jgi:hypothetical protein